MGLIFLADIGSGYYSISFQFKIYTAYHVPPEAAILMRVDDKCMMCYMHGRIRCYTYGVVAPVVGA